MHSHRPPHIHPDDSIIFLTGRLYAGISWLHAEPSKQYFLDKLKEILPRYHIELDAYVICHNHYHLLIQPEEGALLSKFVGHLHGATSHYIREHFPDIVSVRDQVLSREVTKWDKRQTARLDFEAQRLKRELKFATTEIQKQNVLAQFIARNPVLVRRLKSATTTATTKTRTSDVHVALQFALITDPRVLVLLLAKDPPIWYQYMDHVIRDDTDYYKHLNYIHQNPVKHGLSKRVTEYHWSSIHTWVEEKGKEFVIDCFHRYPVVDFQPVAD
ncbi:transposase [Candidatus Gottesmanbacteria bacterium]|nr:transposase [Candidatus Gottesmanbacteria bacterium]